MFPETRHVIALSTHRRMSDAPAPATIYTFPEAPAPSSVDVAPARASAPQLLSAWAEIEPDPRLIVDRRLRLIWANAEARRIIDKGEDLVDLDGQLRLWDLGATETLANHLQRMTVARSCLYLPSKLIDRHLVVRISALEDPGTGPGFGLEIRRTDREPLPDRAAMAKLFGLTRAETRVLDGLAAGKSVDEIAAEADVSIETVRCHVKSIYTKLRVRNRESLFRQLLAYCA